MKAATFRGVIGAFMLLPMSAAQAQVFRSNDTGGIISWSCENEARAPQIAAGACAQWNKYARIVGVHRQYGDFISYRCVWSPKVDRFATPAVPTSTYCASPVEGNYRPGPWPWPPQIWWPWQW